MLRLVMRGRGFDPYGALVVANDTSALDNSGNALVALSTRAWRVSPGLTLLVLVNLVVLPVSVVGRVVDEATFGGVSVWDKPAKFALAFLAFAPMLLWLFSKVESSKLIRRGLGVLGWSMILETVLITMQAARGTTSHFNKTTSFDAAVWRAMSAGVGIFAVAAVVIGVVLARKRLGSGALGLATKLAVAMMTIGALLGNTMTPRKPEQLADSEFVGGHAVGGPDGGAGLPFLGWSTEYGDLRVAHFFGLHALQVVPLLAMGVIWLSRRGTLTLNDQGQRVVTWLGAMAYAGVVLTVLVQALREIPPTEPDGITLVMLAVVAAIPAAIGVLVAVRPTRSLRSSPQAAM